MSDNPKNSEPIVFRDVEEREAWGHAAHHAIDNDVRIRLAGLEPSRSPSEVADDFIRARRAREAKR